MFRVDPLGFTDRFHLALFRANPLPAVRRSLAQNPFTVLTLFVNPTQFAPHEDLASYPRTLPRDLELLRTLLPPSYVNAYEERYRRALGQEPTAGGQGGGAMAGLGVSESDPIRWVFTEPEKGRRRSSSSYPAETLESPLVVFAPQRETMYPLSTIPPEAFLDEDAGGHPANADGAAGEAMLQDTSRQRGAFVEVKGWGDVLEGESRREYALPEKTCADSRSAQFFRGVATVCTKLFNAVEPEHAYFGQKDIQQALILKLSKSRSHQSTWLTLRSAQGPSL